MTDRKHILKKRGLLPIEQCFFDDADEAILAPPLPYGVWVSEELDAEEVVRRWAAVVGEPHLRDLSTFIATEEAGLFDTTWNDLCERGEAFAGTQDSALAGTLPLPDWAGPAVERRFADQALLEILRRLGVDAPEGDIDPDSLDEDLLPLLEAVDASRNSVPPQGSLEALPGSVKCSVDDRTELLRTLSVGEGVSRVFACEGHPATGPLRLGWMWTEEMAHRVALLWEKWHATLGFRPVRVGLSTLDAYVETPPRDLRAVRALVLEQLAFCPDLGQEDDPVVSALLNALGYRWSLWWD